MGLHKSPTSGSATERRNTASSWKYLSLQSFPSDRVPTNSGTLCTLYHIVNPSILAFSYDHFLRKKLQVIYTIFNLSTGYF